MRRSLRTLVAALALAAAAAVTPAAGAAASGNPYGDPHLVSMFDGSTLNGWTQAKAGEWSVAGGAIHGDGTARGWISYNVKQAGTFR
jgi:hypothetical protein